jgi:hypothetical protein
MKLPATAFSIKAYSTLLRAVIIALLCSPAALAQNNCDDVGATLNPAEPTGITSVEIVKKAAAREDLFRQARMNYAYVEDVTVQTLKGSQVDGKYRQVRAITYDDKGHRVENITYAPQSTLTRIDLPQKDFDDIRNHVIFPLATDDLRRYNVLYSGQQHLDEIDTYVFEMKPINVENGQRYFQGRIWIDARDLLIVKTCGMDVAPGRHGLLQKHTLHMVTYREQIDGQYWFPTYSRADEVLPVVTGPIHVREIIKYTNYQRFGSGAKSAVKGEPSPEPVRK